VRATEADHTDRAIPTPFSKHLYWALDPLPLRRPARLEATEALAATAAIAGQAHQAGLAAGAGRAVVEGRFDVAHCSRTANVISDDGGSGQLRQSSEAHGSLEVGGLVQPAAGAVLGPFVSPESVGQVARARARILLRRPVLLQLLQQSTDHSWIQLRSRASITALRPIV